VTLANFVKIESYHISARNGYNYFVQCGINGPCEIYSDNFMCDLF